MRDRAVLVLGLFAPIAALASACAVGPGSDGFADEGGSAGTGMDGSGASLTDASGADTTSAMESATGDVPKLDLAVPDGGGGPMPSCKVGDDIDAPQPCVDVAPPDSFEPDVQWAWAGQDGDTQVAITPVVANLTDDNGDGEIDLCDVPDVVVVAYGGSGQVSTLVGHVYVLDGATGNAHFAIPEEVDGALNPALGDLDGDGVPEIVAATTDDIDPVELGHLIAFHHDGTVAWESATPLPTQRGAISLADVDADGDVEILFAGAIYDHEGAQVLAPVSTASLNTAADLDGDDDLEVIFGGIVIHHDGTPYASAGAEIDHPHVADLDQDGQPEVLLVGQSGITIMEHDGAVGPTDQVPTLATWRPAAVHDMDGDLAPEIAVGSSLTYSVLEADFTPKWTSDVNDNSGFAAGTAFDFLGDGTAEAMYADQTTLFIFDETGAELLTANRESFTQWENPVVVDVDNDGSAEIVVTSNSGFSNGMTPPVQVIRDAQDRWIPARRIWNQHSYHVTNVREDGTIPAVQPKHWLSLNTFRTQSQIDAGGGVCMPEPRG